VLSVSLVFLNVVAMASDEVCDFVNALVTNVFYKDDSQILTAFDID
jgi:hypothetical protein